MAAAASGALPGESLYPIKRGIEQVTTAAHVGNAAKGSALLGQASQRLDEVDGLMSAGSPDADLVSSTLDSFNDQANAGADKLFKAYQTDADSADIATVRDFTASEMSQIASLASSADPSTLGSLRDAADTLADIDQQATTLCASCGGGATLTPPGALAAGAGAATVKNLIARPVTQATADIARAPRRSRPPPGEARRAQGRRPGRSRQARSERIPATPAPARPPPGDQRPQRRRQAVPSVTTDAAGTAVKNLVGGLTTTVTGGGGGSSGRRRRAPEQARLSTAPSTASPERSRAPSTASPEPSSPRSSPPAAPLDVVGRILRVPGVLFHWLTSESGL